MELTLTSDNDPELHALIESMQKETRGLTGWKRIAQLMIKLDHFDKAEELYEILLQQMANEVESRLIKENMKRRSFFMKRHLKSSEKLFLQMILLWVVPTIVSVWYMRT